MSGRDRRGQATGQGDGGKRLGRGRGVSVSSSAEVRKSPSTVVGAFIIVALMAMAFVRTASCSSEHPGRIPDA